MATLEASTEEHVHIDCAPRKQSMAVSKKTNLSCFLMYSRQIMNPNVGQTKCYPTRKSDFWFLNFISLHFESID